MAFPESPPTWPHIGHASLSLSASQGTPNSMLFLPSQPLLPSSTPGSLLEEVRGSHTGAEDMAGAAGQALICGSHPHVDVGEL